MAGNDAHFDGFSRSGLGFLEKLGSANKSWFDDNRKTYETEVVAPTKAFVTAIGEQLRSDISSGIVSQPKTNGSIAPINNDLRFSPDKSPYKDHLLLRFWEGENKKTAPTLHIRLSTDGVGFATGAMFPDIDHWRELIDDEYTGSELAMALADLGEGRELDVVGEGYKRVPKPYADDHPRAGLLRHKWIQARWSEPLPKNATTPGFVDFCTDRLAHCSPVHNWLVTNL